MQTWQDVRYSLRSLRKSPTFSIAIILSLGLAMGANAAVFTFFKAILLEPMPFADVDELVRVRELRMEDGKEPIPISVTGANYTAWKESNRSFEDLAAQIPVPFNMIGDGEPEQILGSQVTANYLDVLGVKPVLGRSFTPDEDRPGSPAAVVVVGYDLWQRRFNGDRAIVGKTITLDQQAYQIIGVAPPRFKFPYRAEMWRPLGLAAEDPELWNRRRLNVFARLREGVSLEQASAEMEGIASRMAQQFPDTNRGWGVELTGLREDLVGEIRPRLVAIFAAAGFVLLIASFNAANLLLARSLDHSNEVSIRVALGAGRARVARQFMTQSVVLAVVAGAFGTLLAFWALTPMAALSPMADLDASFEEALRLDWRVLGFSFLTSLLVGAVFGALPAFQVSRPNLQSLLKEGGRTGTGRGNQGWLRAFVVAEIAVAVILLTGAGLMLRSFQRLQGVDVGFDPEGLLVAEMSLPATSYPERPEQRAFYEQVLERVRALPGVKSAAVTTNHPFTGEFRVAPFILEDRQAEAAAGESIYMTNHRVVSPGYLETLGTRLLQGRLLTAQDREGSLDVVVVSKRFADTYWPGQNPVGKRVRVNRPDTPWLTVVGVVADVNDQGEYKESWYVPYLQDWRFTEMALLVRTEGDPLALADSVRKAVWSVAPTQPVYGIERMGKLAANVLRPQRFSTLLYAFFGSLALILAVIGIYGLMSYAVAQRFREFGIRIALGAPAAQIKSGVLRNALTLTLLGLLIGSALALALTRYLASLLYETSPTDPVTFLSVLLILAVVALLGSYFPARRATRVDPVTALRYE